MARKRVAAIIAAAGLSTRMGEPKQLLPWGDGTVLSTIIENLGRGGANPVICVVGHRSKEIANSIVHTDAITITNLAFREGEMLSSLQAGIQHIMDKLEPGSNLRFPGVLLSLGDQPQLPVPVVESIIAQADITPEAIIIPSFEMRRGHPIYLPRRFWKELQQLNHNQSLRVLLNRHTSAITYVNVHTDAILRDIDTPEEYATLRQKSCSQHDG